MKVTNSDIISLDSLLKYPIPLLLTEIRSLSYLLIFPKSYLFIFRYSQGGIGFGCAQINKRPATKAPPNP